MEHVQTHRGSLGRAMAGALALALGLLGAREVARATDSNDVRFPRGYREWKHVKSALVGPQSPFYETGGGLHHVYANDEAMKEFRSGSFPDGSVLVFELLATIEKAGVTSEGARHRVDVMLKDRGLYPASGAVGAARVASRRRGRLSHAYSARRPVSGSHRAACTRTRTNACPRRS